MSEQFWYTWSPYGFGRHGWRIRAASPGFIDARNMINEYSEPVLTLLKYMGYNLPLDTTKPDEVTPLQAPRSLAFVQTKSETPEVVTMDVKHALIHKVYAGVDAADRSGNYFCHLITDLPGASSPCPSDLSFSAREAIELWGSPFWQSSDQDLQPSEKVLPKVAPDDLTSASQSLQDLLMTPEEQAMVRTWLKYLLHTIIHLSDLKPHQQIYIIAPPQVVAALIWG